MSPSRLDAVGSYLYNAFEQQVQKTAGATTTQFVYDRAGHLLEVANGATGAMEREYLWLDDLPVAMLDDSGASPVLYYIHTDQLGTPQKITDGNANVVWEGLYDPFGNAITITGANWGTGIWGSFDWAPTSPPITATNLRFPGQYADAETALNQNWNRDYDPSAGRYIQSDPIGLDGGNINSYAYAGGQVTLFVDPDGNQTIIGAAVGAGVGAVAGYAEGGNAGAFFGGLAGGAIGFFSAPAADAVGAAIGAYIGQRTATTIGFGLFGGATSGLAQIAINRSNCRPLLNDVVTATSIGATAPFLSLEAPIVALTSGLSRLGEAALSVQTSIFTGLGAAAAIHANSEQRHVVVASPK